MKEQKNLNHILARVILLCAGLSVMAIGVAFSIKAALGTSPISSVPFVDRDNFRPFCRNDYGYHELYICADSDPYPEKKI